MSYFFLLKKESLYNTSVNFLKTICQKLEIGKILAQNAAKRKKMSSYASFKITLYIVKPPVAPNGFEKKNPQDS